MIIGVGADIIEIERVGRLVERGSFPSRVFAEDEVDACESEGLTGKRRASRFAGLFAAKEAVMKALGTGWSKGVAWVDIRVTHSAGGKPEVRLHGRTKEIADSMGVMRIHLSISHDEGCALAFVVLEG